MRFRFGIFCGLAAAVMAIALCGGQPARAQDAGAAPKATPSPFAVGVIEPLREIGRIKARTPFCRAFLEHASVGVSSAIAFEMLLLDTVQDFRHAKLGDELGKHLSLRKLENDLNRLADLSLAGREALDELKSLPADSERHKELVDFVNALNGAKGRQMDLARKLSRTYGRLAEMPVYTNVTLPTDGAAGAFVPSASYGTTNVVDLGDAMQAFELRQNVFDAMPGDEMVGRDLARAADHGKTALVLGGC